MLAAVQLIYQARESSMVNKPVEQLLDHPAAADDEGPQPGAEGPLLLPDPQLLLMMKAPHQELMAPYYC